jgi:GNAT superfamily N-acetyltransferase
MTSDMVAARAAEDGTLWALEPGRGLPPPCPARVEVVFGEVGTAEVAELAAAMNLPGPEPIEQRLENGRRCFTLRADGRIVSYGWVTHGAESVGELERQFNLEGDEAYIWDCGTRPEMRGQRCYSALLSQIVCQLHQEGVSRIWIGSGRQNKASIRGFANAGFRPVIECDYRRYYRLTLLWVRPVAGASSGLVAAAHRILINPHERRLGRLAIGHLHDA